MLLSEEKKNKFFVGICKFDLHIQNSHSLKEKRKVIKSLEEKLKNRFNISMCEFGELSLWQRTRLAIVTCSNEFKITESIIKSVIRYIEQDPSVMVVNSETEIL